MSACDLTMKMSAEIDPAVLTCPKCGNHMEFLGVFGGMSVYQCSGHYLTQLPVQVEGMEETEIVQTKPEQLTLF